MEFSLLTFGRLMKFVLLFSGYKNRTSKASSRLVDWCHLVAKLDLTPCFKTAGTQIKELSTGAWLEKLSSIIKALKKDKKLVVRIGYACIKPRGSCLGLSTLV